MNHSYQYAVPLSCTQRVLGLLVLALAVASPAAAQADLVFADALVPNSVCLEEGDGDYACSVVSPDLSTSLDVAVADFDGQHGPDFAFANALAKDRVCLSQPSGGYACSSITGDETGTTAVTAADLDGQFGPDLVFADLFTPNRICLNDGTGTFACFPISADLNGTQDVAVADFDGQFGPDLVFANALAPNRVCLSGQSGYTCSDIDTQANGTLGVAVADLDRQGGPDLAFANAFDCDRVCLNDGTGGFTCANVSAETTGTQDVAAADLDGQFGPDLVFADLFTPNRVCLNDGTGTFACFPVSADFNASRGVAVGDLDGQFGPDLAFANAFAPNRVCFSGESGYTCTDVSDDASATSAVALGDFGAATPLEYDLVVTPTSPLSVAPGGSVDFDYTVTNNTDEPVSGDLFFTASQNGFHIASGVIRTGMLRARQTVGARFTQRVPQGTPPGSYTYDLSVRMSPPAVDDTETFTIVVTPSANRGGANAWTVTDASPWKSVGEANGQEGPIVMAYPNPLRTHAMLRFDVPEAGTVRLAVYDALGREVAVLVDGQVAAGSHEAVFSGQGLPSGVYVWRLEAGAAAETGRLTVLR